MVYVIPNHTISSPAFFLIVFIHPNSYCSPTLPPLRPISYPTSNHGTDPQVAGGDEGVWGGSLNGVRGSVRGRVPGGTFGVPVHESWKLFHTWQSILLTIVHDRSEYAVKSVGQLHLHTPVEGMHPPHPPLPTCPVPSILSPSIPSPFHFYPFPVKFCLKFNFRECVNLFLVGANLSLRHHILPHGDH